MKIMHSIVLAAAAAAIIASSALADRLIMAPGGSTLPIGGLKYEAIFSGGDHPGDYQWFQVGVPHFEFQAVQERSIGGRNEWGFGGELEVIPANGVLPGLSLGVRDINNRTSQGRAYYAAASYTIQAPPGLNLFAKSVGINIGLGTDSIKGGFGGLDMKTSWKASLLVEHDSRNWNFGIRYPVTEYMHIQALSLNGRPFFGFSITNGKSSSLLGDLSKLSF